jgi:hypothetical protein
MTTPFYPGWIESKITRAAFPFPASPISTTVGRRNPGT